MPESKSAVDSGLEYTPPLPPWCTSGQYWPSPHGPVYRASTRWVSCFTAFGTLSIENQGLCPDLLMRRRRVDEAADSRTGPRRPRRGYGDDIPAHTQDQGGLPNRLPGVDDRGNSGRRVPRRHYPTISYPCDKNTIQNNTPSGEHSENI
ncbi:hypothetical protein THAOC_10356 [Thalassiosira oceanica]|uniref:Uncharacterized protein n=1 Tax=Thalassiosira oceanica TaxID=159749 RepID=K0TD73_THAOC|nr:hypothetical protein THAOC_10356 [Thalassiosira oceanica]|eukprot:EJK68462.1 hypothetical protein THAOC_10356 [Thalassiosira oceanica]